jgi:hypothetical protein
MSHVRTTRRLLSRVAPLFAFSFVFSCGESATPGSEVGSACEADAQCQSGRCEGGICTDAGVGGTSNASGGTPSTTGGTSSATGGSSNTTGGSATTTGGTSSATGGASNAAGSASVGTTPPGGACTVGGDCTTGVCIDGVCGSTGTPGTTTTAGPHFPGSGGGFRPLTSGCGPETANDCTGTCEQAGGDPNVAVVRPPGTLCFGGEGDPTPDDPAVVIEQVIEKKDGKEYVHIRVTFDPAFTDNTYGEGSCCGWPEARGHWFRDLTGSDHTELLLTDATGATVMHFKLDFITAQEDTPCGHDTLGVNGGDGSMLVGDATHVLAVATSLDRNLNGCGYCMNDACASSGDCTVDSPATDTSFTPNPGTPDWDYRQVYEVWIDMAAFNGLGFGQAFITYTHSSPAKGPDTITVVPEPCPPDWDVPYCPPSVIAEGGNCFGDNGPCPPNQQVYITSEGASECTPIPFTNYDDMKPCPDGYVLDVATEGQFCVRAQ